MTKKTVLLYWRSRKLQWRGRHMGNSWLASQITQINPGDQRSDDVTSRLPSHPVIYFIYLKYSPNREITSYARGDSQVLIVIALPKSSKTSVYVCILGEVTKQQLVYQFSFWKEKCYVYKSSKPQLFRISPSITVHILCRKLWVF